MPSDMASEKPCTVPAGQGFSVLYKGRYLYSKYAPQKAVLQAVQQLTIQPNTAVICFSPCLCYGLTELLQKLPGGCMVFGCELEEPLHELAAQHFTDSSSSVLLSVQESSRLHELLQKRRYVTKSGVSLPPPGTFKRVITITFSAGYAFHEQYYQALAAAAQDAAGQFWKNRLTLIKFGRLYSRNLFQNLAHLPGSVPLQTIARTVTRPIIVAGAGESLLAAVPDIRRLRNRLYVLAVDAALPVLLSSGITPDAAAGMECQAAIEKAYIGCRRHGIMLFADIISRPHVTQLTGGNICFFTSRYDDTDFLERTAAAGVLPPVIPPLGSIGLTATQIALFLRADGNVPVILTGLDFAYTEGHTHANGAPAHTARLIAQNRLYPAANYDASFGPGTMTAGHGPGGRIVTTKALEGYARKFRDYFAAVPELYNAGGNLLLNMTQTVPPDQLDALTAAAGTSAGAVPEYDKILKSSAFDTILQAVRSFLLQEQAALESLRELLMHGQHLSKQEFDRTLLELLNGREYLYLHFPDGYALTTDQSFLKRIRTEADFFLKDIQAALRRLP